MSQQQPSTTGEMLLRNFSDDPSRPILEQMPFLEFPKTDIAYTFVTRKGKGFVAEGKTRYSAKMLEILKKI